MRPLGTEERLDLLARRAVELLAEVECIRAEHDAGLPLADRAALMLLAHPDGLGCEPLARRLGVRTSGLRELLRTDPRFAREGDGRRTRWRVRPAMPRDGMRDGLQGHARAQGDRRAASEERAA